MNGRARRAVCFTIGLWLAGQIGFCAPGGSAEKPVTKEEIRDMVSELRGLNSVERKARMEKFTERMGNRLSREVDLKTYRPGKVGKDTQVFEFKQVPGRTLKMYVEVPGDWKPTDKRPAILFWHGGGFTGGSAGQFYNQARYFAQRGAVVAMPEYRVRDIDGTLPSSGLEDAISAMRWFRGRAESFGVDPDKIAAGGGSAGGCVASVLGTADAKVLAEMGCIGADDDPSVSFTPSAMILYNPFVDFFEPLNDRHIEEECLMLGEDPIELEPLFHELSGIEKLTENSPPSIILFGTRDAFYPQQIRWIVKCRELGLTVHDYVYKGEVHSWYNNSPHLEYTTENVNKFLVEIGFLDEEPRVELPHKNIQSHRDQIQQKKYNKKTDWDEQEELQTYLKEHDITRIPYKFYEGD